MAVRVLESIVVGVCTELEPVLLSSPLPSVADKADFIDGLSRTPQRHYCTEVIGSSAAFAG